MKTKTSAAVVGALSLALVGLTTTSAQAATNWTYDAGAHVAFMTGSLPTGTSVRLLCTTGGTMQQQVGTSTTSTGVPCADVRDISIKLDSGGVDLSSLTSATVPNLRGTGAVAEMVTGSFANDSLRAVHGTNSTLDGGAGKDFLLNGVVARGGGGDDFLQYGAEEGVPGSTSPSTSSDGFDALARARVVGATLDGGEGNDQLVFAFGADVTTQRWVLTDTNVMFTSDQWSMTAPQPITNIEQVAFARLTAGASVNATAMTHNLLVYGPGAGITVRGGVANDYVNVEAGAVFGGPGADTLTVRESLPSTLDGGPGGDKLTAAAGADTIQAKDGEIDTIDCGGGTDTAYVDAIDVVKNCERINPTPETGPVGGKARLYQRTHHATRIVRVALPAVATDQRLECRLDRRAWAPCAGRFTLRPRALKRGRHVLAVRAAIYDLLDPTPSTFRFTIKR